MSRDTHVSSSLNTAPQELISWDEMSRREPYVNGWGPKGRAALSDRFFQFLKEQKLDVEKLPSDHELAAGLDPAQRSEMLLFGGEVAIRDVEFAQFWLEEVAVTESRAA